MIFVKSVLAGLGSVVLVSILYLVALIVRAGKAEPGTEIGIDPVSLFKSSPLYGKTGIIIFALRFYWEYRRVRSRGAK